MVLFVRGCARFDSYENTTCTENEIWHNCSLQGMNDIKLETS